MPGHEGFYGELPCKLLEPTEVLKQDWWSFREACGPQYIRKAEMTSLHCQLEGIQNQQGHTSGTSMGAFSEKFNWGGKFTLNVVPPSLGLINTFDWINREYKLNISIYLSLLPEYVPSYLIWMLPWLPCHSELGLKPYLPCTAFSSSKIRELGKSLE